MPYLNVDLDYFEHPKTLRLIGLLGKGSAELPLRLWCKVGKYHARDGRLAGYSAQEIESLVGWWGAPEKCVEALVAVGFLEATKKGDFAVHDWKDHEGHIYAYRKKAQKMAKARWDAVSNAASNANAVPAVPNLPSHAVKQPVVRPVDSHGESQRQRPVPGPVQAMKERELLELRWPIDGEYKHVYVSNLPIDYCQWALKNIRKLGEQLRNALDLRIKMHAEDTKR